jgi:hypothetical protein
MMLALVACGRLGFDELPSVTPSCEPNVCMSPAAVCWTGASCTAGCPPVVPLDQGACPSGSCAGGICLGNAGAPFAHPPAGADANFGASVDSDGKRMIVGAVKGNAAYVLESSNGNWSVTASLTSTWGPPGSYFGGAVAIDGDLAVVGARYSKGPGLPTGLGGAVVVFRRDPSANTWSEIAQVLGPDTGEFGGAVDISGTRILVGAEYANTLVDGYGTAYVLEQSGQTWVVVATLNESTADRLGHFVQLAGDRAVVGSLWDPGPMSTETGGVRIWELQSGTTWTRIAKLQPDDPRPDAFGQGFSLDGDQLAIGVPWFSDGDRGTGAVYVYTRDPAGQWQTPGPIVPAVPARDANRGRGVLLRGDRLVATSIDWSTTPSGAVSLDVYRRQLDGSWLEVARRVDPGGGDNGFAIGGIEVDLQMTGFGDTAVVGFPVRNYSNGLAPGAIVVHDLTGL